MTSDDFAPYRVIQFFEDFYEVVKTDLDAEAAIILAAHLTKSVAARHGIVHRVIVTDRDDCTNFEWRHGEGVVYPERQESRP